MYFTKQRCGATTKWALQATRKEKRGKTKTSGWPEKSTLSTGHQILIAPQLIMQENYQENQWICYFLMSSSEDILTSYTTC